MINTNEMCELLGGVSPTTVTNLIRDKIIPVPRKIAIKSCRNAHVKNMWTDEQGQIALENMKSRKICESKSRKARYDNKPTKETMNTINSVFR